MKGIINISDAAAIGIHTVILLSTNEDKFFTNKELADLLKVSDNHLSKILQRLSKAGIVNSIRGPKGGFVLNKKPEKITLKEVYEAIDGPMIFSDCLLNEPFCSNNCLLGDLITSINDKVNHYFKNTKISDFKDKINQ